MRCLLVVRVAARRDPGGTRGLGQRLSDGFPEWACGLQLRRCIGVQRGEYREVHAFGVRNVKGDLPIRADARMRQASTSKAFSGAVALSLVYRGELSLNDTVGEYLPGLPKA